MRLMGNTLEHKVLARHFSGMLSNTHQHEKSMPGSFRTKAMSISPPTRCPPAAKTELSNLFAAVSLFYVFIRGGPGPQRKS